VTVGAVAGAAATGGAGVAATTARFGPKAGAMTAAATRLGDDGDGDRNGDSSPTARTNQDRIATDDGGVAAYRRRENDPAYY
jgi:hypothetical protein